MFLLDFHAPYGQDLNGANTPWKATPDQLESYVKNDLCFSGSPNAVETGRNVAAGLFYNFGDIELSWRGDGGRLTAGKPWGKRESWYICIDGKTNTKLTPKTFLKNGAHSLHSLTFIELCRALNLDVPSDPMKINNIDYDNGLFSIGHPGEFWYDYEDDVTYYLVWCSGWATGFYVKDSVKREAGSHAGGERGGRPVLTLPDHSKLEITGN